MDSQHLIKISDFLFEVTRTNQDGSLMVWSSGFTGRVIPSKRRLIFTDVKGRIKSVEVRL